MHSQSLNDPDQQGFRKQNTKVRTILIISISSVFAMFSTQSKASFIIQDTCKVFPA